MDEEELKRRRQIVFSAGFQAGRKTAFEAIKRNQEEKFKRTPEYMPGLIQKIIAMKDELDRRELREIFTLLGYKRENYSQKKARQLTPFLYAAGFIRGRKKIAGKSVWVWQYEGVDNSDIPSYESTIDPM